MSRDHLLLVLSSQALQSCYLLAEMVHPAEDKPQFYLRTAASVNLDSRANNLDPPGQRGAAVATDRVSVHPRFDRSYTGIACRPSA